MYYAFLVLYMIGLQTYVLYVYGVGFTGTHCQYEYYDTLHTLYSIICY